MSTDYWLAWSDLAAMTQSSAFPADEYDQPDCNAMIQGEDAPELYCTRAPGHPDRHLAALSGTYDGHPLFVVVAAWPGANPPVTRNAA